MNLRGFVLPAIAVAAWEVGARLAQTESDLLARPTQIVARAASEIADGAMTSAFGQTLVSTAGGLALGGALGVLFGLLTGLSRRTETLTYASVELLRPVPSVALIPSVMLLFGFGYRFEIAIVAFACFWPVSIMTHAAIRAIEPRLFDVARVLNFGFAERATKIYLPAILPRLFVALRLALGLALVVAVTVEIAANPQGIGFVLTQAQQTLQPDLLFAALLCIGVVGWGINAGLLGLEKRLFHLQEH